MWGVVVLLDSRSQDPVWVVLVWRGAADWGSLTAADWGSLTAADWGSLTAADWGSLTAADWGSLTVGVWCPPVSM